MLLDRLEELRAVPLGWRDRWFAASNGEQLPLDDLREAQLSIFDGAVLPPVPVIREDRLNHNIDLMQSYCDRRGVLLAPHAKTTMAPEIWRRQLEAGAWGLTAANVSQARVMEWFGTPRVLIANEVVDPASVAWLAAATGPERVLEVTCLVDSVIGVQRMHDALTRAGYAGSLPVLVEIGVVGGRTGCRTIDDARSVIEAVSRSPVLRLSGVECYEGLIQRPTLSERLKAVDDYLETVAGIVDKLIEGGAFDHLDQIIVSGGGSWFFDRVIDALGPERFGPPVSLLLRSGCYVAHDCSLYEEISPLGGVRGNEMSGRLGAAVEIWSTVLSRPEREIVICSAGKRDISADYLLPEPISFLPALTTAREIQPSPSNWRVRGLMDHHTFLECGADDRISAGDWVALGINHPCTTFDKWGSFALVDEDYVMRDVIRTCFD